MELEQKKKMPQEQTKDLSGNICVMKFNNDPNAKNYSNCDILGSFYEVTEQVSKTDISGNVLKKLR